MQASTNWSPIDIFMYCYGVQHSRNRAQDPTITLYWRMSDLLFNFVLAMGVAFFSSSLSTFINWFLCYRTEKFQSESALIERKQEELKQLRSRDDDDGNERRIQKKIKHLEDEIALFSRNVSMMSMKSNMITMFCTLVINQLMKSYFMNCVVCKIPFEPFSLVTSMSHRGLETEDMTDGSYTFVYWLSTLVFRDVINKWFGFKSPSLAMPSNFMEQMPR